MKTNELIKELEAMGFKCTFCDGYYHTLYVYNKDNNMTVASVDVTKMFSVHTMFTAFLNLEETKKQQLFNLLTEYASTPIKERKEEKKYMYRLKK